MLRVKFSILNLYLGLSLKYLYFLLQWWYESQTSLLKIQFRSFSLIVGWSIIQTTIWMPVLKSSLHWGSEIQTSLDFDWSKRGWVANGLNLEWDLKFRSPTVWNPDKWPTFCQKPLEIRTKMSGYRMVGTIAIATAKDGPFKFRPSKSTDFKWSKFRSPLYLNGCLNSGLFSCVIAIIAIKGSRHLNTGTSDYLTGKMQVFRC